MGSNLEICESRTPDFVNEETIEDIDFQGNFQKLEDSIQRPPISQQLSDLIPIKKSFFKQLNRIFSPKKINYKGGMYLGQISKFRSPQRWGKLYCQNGDVLIGQFSKGELMGKCFLGRPNGSYYQGEVANGKLNCEQGIYYCHEFQYVGGFNDNSFHRKRRIIKKNSNLEGDFVDGVISYCKLQWKQNGQTYIYTGQFNQQLEMHGKGNFNLNLQETLNNLIERTQVNSDLITNEAMENTDIQRQSLQRPLCLRKEKRLWRTFLPFRRNHLQRRMGRRCP